ncbi:MAG: PLP-dependent lyase/thiolase [bacterium]|nr:PLP-dependent lyase/thiolase [bacterium]
MKTDQKTPTDILPELGKILGLKLFFKREDLHPLGSHKGRSIPVMIDYYAKKGARKFAISSSGNAALAAGIYIQSLNKKILDMEKKLSLTIFVGEHVNKEKNENLKEKLADEEIKLVKTARPLQELFRAEKEGKTSLRQSTDDTALLGYAELAEELSTVPNLSAIFLAASSGTSTQALAEYFEKRGIGPVQIFLVQTAKIHTMAKIFDKNFIEEKESLADAIVDIVGHRKEKVAEAVKTSGGFGWVVSNQEIEEAVKIIKENTDIKDITANGSLSFAGLLKALKYGFKPTGAAVCVIGGK